MHVSGPVVVGAVVEWFVWVCEWQGVSRVVYEVVGEGGAVAGIRGSLR